MTTPGLARFARSALALTFTFSAFACGKGTGGGMPAPTGLASADDFQQKLAVANCVNGAKCGQIGASEEKGCESSNLASLTAYPSGYSYDDAITAKRLAFDGQAAADCVARVTAAGCTVDQYFAAVDPCSAVFTPLVEVGGTCLSSIECKAGYCDMGSVQTDGCSGSCKAYLAAGATCDPQNDHCDASTFCDATTKQCAARVGSGATCSSTAPCQAGLFCKGNVAATMTMAEVPGACAGPGAAGDSCQQFFFGNTDCTPGLYCDDAIAKPVCAARLATGAACDHADACQDGLDCIGLTHDQNTGAVTKKGTCGAWADVNAACPIAMADETGCPYDAVCDATSSTCKVVGKAGDDCSSNGTQGSCQNNLYCDGTSMQCTPAVALGAACTPPPNQNAADPCQSGSCDATTKVCTLVCM